MDERTERVARAMCQVECPSTGAGSSGDCNDRCTASLAYLEHEGYWSMAAAALSAVDAYYRERAPEVAKFCAELHEFDRAFRDEWKARMGDEPAPGLCGQAAALLTSQAAQIERMRDAPKFTLTPEHIDAMARAIERTYADSDVLAEEGWQDENTRHNRRLEARAAGEALVAMLNGGK